MFTDKDFQDDKSADAIDRLIICQINLYFGGEKMNTCKKVMALIFSIILLFTYCVSNVNATESYHWYRFDDTDGMIRYFHKNNQQIGSYAEAGGTISSTTGFINGKTYVENYHPSGTPLYNVYVIIAYVDLYIYCEHGTIRSRESLLGCHPTDDT